MEYTTLGSTGREVSRICLGCKSFGTGWVDWSLDKDDSREIIERAIDLGVNFFDITGTLRVLVSCRTTSGNTVNVYSYGESEEILGNVLADYNREEQVVATKVFNPPEEESHPNATGLSRKTIEQELANSLDRLGMETVDLYQIHRWDYDTPIEQTLRALDDAVRREQVRYIGASSMWAHQFAEALHTSDRLDLERFVTMQDHYNLVYREEEREMLPFCEQEGIGVIPWSPLAQGYLARPREELASTTRGQDLTYWHEEYRMGGGPEVNNRVKQIAEDKGITMAQVSLA